MKLGAWGMAMLTAGSVAAAEPRAIVVLLKGTVTISTEGAAARTAVLFDQLSEGSRVEAPGAVVLAWPNGDRFELVGRARVAIDGPVDVVGTVKRLDSLKVAASIAPINAKTSGRTAAVRVRSREREPEILLEPDGEDRVLADLSVLRFFPRRATGRYKVDVEDDAGSTILSVETTQPEVSVPNGVLKAGAFYYWRVRSLPARGAGPAVDAVFETLPADLAADRAKVAQLASDASGWLLLSRIDRELGLRTEACRDLAQALALAPDLADSIAVAKVENRCR